MIQRYYLLVLFLPLVLIFTGCEALFGSKEDDVTDEIFREGAQDPNLIVEEVGYAALLPFWDDFLSPTDVHIGFDELVYVTDEIGLHVLDRAGRRFATYELQGANRVVQDRNLNIFVAARLDTIITAVDDELIWNLPVVYKLRGLNQGLSNVRVIDKIVHPFRDASRPTTNAQRGRLNKESAINDEFVEITGLAILEDNTLYVSRRGPRNVTGQPFAPDNTVLVYVADQNGQMQNLSQIRALSPNTPSLISGIAINDIQTFVGPPQREQFTSDRSFIIAQGDPSMNIPFRVLWINATVTPDGLIYQPRTELLANDTTRADSFLYDQFKFENPSALTFTADARNQIIVMDSGTHKLHLFQSNGQEGVPPPAGSTQRKAINVSFGGLGSGPREFNNPSGVHYFRRIVYVADTGNNRISRYRLNTDFE